MSSSHIKPIPKILNDNISSSIFNLTIENNTKYLIDLKINPLLPIVITLSSILVLFSCVLLIRYIYNKRREHKIFTSKNNESQKNDHNIEPDIETGEKKNTDRQLFSHKNSIKSNSRSIKKLKTRSTFVKNNKEKKNVSLPTNNQEENKNKKKRVREILLERSKKIPHGKSNKNIKTLLTRLSVNGSKNSIENLSNIDIINNIPNNPPPILGQPILPPQEDTPIKSQDIYQNPHNNLSPKMLVNEING